MPLRPLLQVVPNTRLKHILSLWQVLAARRSMLLVQMNQVRKTRLGEETGFYPAARERKYIAAARWHFYVPVSSLAWVQSRSRAYAEDSPFPWVLSRLTCVLEALWGP